MAAPRETLPSRGLRMFLVSRPFHRGQESSDDRKYMKDLVKNVLPHLAPTDAFAFFEHAYRFYPESSISSSLTTHLFVAIRDCVNDDDDEAGRNMHNLLVRLYQKRIPDVVVRLFASNDGMRAIVRFRTDLARQILREYAADHRVFGLTRSSVENGNVPPMLALALIEEIANAFVSTSARNATMNGHIVDAVEAIAGNAKFGIAARAILLRIVVSISSEVPVGSAVPAWVRLFTSAVSRVSTTEDDPHKAYDGTTDFLDAVSLLVNAVRDMPSWSYCGNVPIAIAEQLLGMLIRVGRDNPLFSVHLSRAAAVCGLLSVDSPEKRAISPSLSVHIISTVERALEKNGSAADCLVLFFFACRHGPDTHVLVNSQVCNCARAVIRSFDCLSDETVTRNQALMLAYITGFSECGGSTEKWNINKTLIATILSVVSRISVAQDGSNAQRRLFVILTACLDCVRERLSEMNNVALAKALAVVMECVSLDDNAWANASLPLHSVIELILYRGHIGSYCIRQTANMVIRALKLRNETQCSKTDLFARVCSVATRIRDETHSYGSFAPPAYLQAIIDIMRSIPNACTTGGGNRRALIMQKASAIHFLVYTNNFEPCT